MTATAAEQTFLLPDLGEGLTEAAVVRWLVAEGDVVTVDQTVVEVETAKSVVDVPSPFAGRVGTLHAVEGAAVEVGAPLITVIAEQAPAAAGSGNVLIGYGTSAHVGPVRGRRPRRSRPTPTATPVPGDGPVKVVSPIVRRLAREAHLDLRTVPPTGPGGVVTRSDVQAAVDGEQRIPLSGLRKAAATVLARSRSEIPEATVWVDVDATELWELREAARTAADPGPGLLAYLARFVLTGLAAYPVLNSRLDVEHDQIVVADRINLGLAVQGELGLVVPAVLDAGSMSTARLDAAIRDVTARARTGRATAEELAAGTFTLNNYGSLGVDGSAAIINHPQVAIVGFGRIIDRPWVVDGQIVPRKITQMSFVFDHRVCDGGTAAGFMRHVADAIENPLPTIVRL